MSPLKQSDTRDESTEGRRRSFYTDNILCARLGEWARGERSDTELRKVGRRKRRRFHFQETTVTEEEGVERHISHQKGERENKERHG